MALMYNALHFLHFLTLSYKIRSLKHRNVTSKGYLKVSLNAWIIDFVDCRRVRKRFAKQSVIGRTIIFAKKISLSAKKWSGQEKMQ